MYGDTVFRLTAVFVDILQKQELLLFAVLKKNNNSVFREIEFIKIKRRPNMA